jgi:hypothetical protein
MRNLFALLFACALSSCGLGSPAFAQSCRLVETESFIAAAAEPSETLFGVAANAFGKDAGFDTPLLAAFIVRIGDTREQHLFVIVGADGVPENYAIACTGPIGDKIKAAIAKHFGPRV